MSAFQPAEARDDSTVTSSFAEDLVDSVRQVPGGIWRSYLAPERRVWYMALNKNACTSLKWMMADLAGEDLTTIRAGWLSLVEDSQAVHDRRLWKVSPRLGNLTCEQFQEIQEGKWFIFSVVRDPRLRLFSAWQNRILMEPPNSQVWREEPWYPRHPMTTETVVDDFAAFVRFLADEPQSHLRAKDPHFRDQTELLIEHAVPYTKIYDMSEMSELRHELGVHVRSHGYDSELYLPRSNPTPLHAVGELFENGVDELIREIYSADFERFGHLWTDFSHVTNAEAWRKLDLASCEQQAVLGRRITELHTMASAQRARADRAEKASNFRKRLPGAGRSIARTLRYLARRIRPR